MKNSVWLGACRSIIEPCLELLYPNWCQVCQSQPATAAEGYVCGACWTRPGGVRFIRPPFCDRCGLPFEGAITSEFECGNCKELELDFVAARAAVSAKGMVRDVIHRYKYRGAVWFEPFLADLLLRAARSSVSPSTCDLIVPVPLHPVRFRERQFNQAERLGRALSEATGVPLSDRLLARVKATETQTQLSRSERSRNMGAAFRFVGHARLSGERIVLVDDVLTTGATTSACARVLRRAGAGPVCVWTVARGV